MARQTAAWQRSFAWDVLDALGARQTSRMRYAIIAWQTAECGIKPVNMNPLNVFSKGKHKTYKTLDEAAADVGKIMTSSPFFARWAGYDKVVKAARNNDPMTFMVELAKCKWDAGRYGTLKGGPNRIIPLYREYVDGLPGKHWFDSLPNKSGEEME